MKITVMHPPDGIRVPPQRRTRWLAFALALGAPACHAPLKPTETQPVKGTYTLTVTTSSTCRVRGSWRMRADINQTGRDLDIELSEGDFNDLGFLGGDKLNRFNGQDNPDGVLLFSRGGSMYEYLFDEAKAGAWHHGQARGEFRGDRINAVFDGTFSPYGNIDSERDACRAADHSWTFIRR